MKEKQVKLLGDIVIFDKRFKGISRDIQKNIVSFIHVSAEELKKMKHENGTIKLLSTGLFTGYTTKELASNYINKGEVITIPTGGTANIKYHNGEFVDSGNILCVSKYRDIDLKFVYYALLYNKDYIESCYKGTGIKHPYMPDIWNIPIPIPSITEQQSIVIYINSQFAKIDAIRANAEKQLKEAKALFQSALKDYLTPKDGWEESTIGEISNICGRIGFRGYTTKDMVAGPKDGAITLSPSNIKDGVMDYSKCQYISWYKYEESPEIMINNGDVLIVKTGSSYGKSAIVTDLPHKATINPQSVVIKNIKINNRFFAYLIRTPWIQQNFDNFVAGTAIPTFSQANLSKVILAYPDDNTQNKIVYTLDKISAKIHVLQSNFDTTVTLCNDLKQSILKDIFS